MSPVDWAIVAYAYIAVIVFVIGTIVTLIRWIFVPKGPSGTFLGYPYLFTYPGNNTRLLAFKNILSRIFLFSSMKNDPSLRISSAIFHWTLWIVIAAHLDIVLMPYFSSIGVSEKAMSAIGDYLGTSLAIVMVGFGAYLFIRRNSSIYMRKISYLSDYFSILLILALGVSGIIMRFTLPPLYAYNEVTPFIYSLIHLSPVFVPTAIQFVVHFLIASTLLIYFPFSKFMHPYSFFTNPTMYSIFHPGEINESKN
ncbi:MAG: respiratory nitrate reductase subunit gamma [Thermoplasmatales archaeon]